jgi:phosphate transport system substrate-binding protein
LTRNVKLVALFAVIALVGAACSKSDGTGGTDLSGKIIGDGSSTVFPISEAVAEEFRKENSGVKISVGESGTGGGFKKFCKGETDFQDASRPIKDEEKTECANGAVEYFDLTVANDGLSIVVNKQNTWATCLTTDELKKIWEPGSKVKNWNQIRSEFPSQPLKLFGPGTDSGTFDYFTKEINGEEDASRTDYTPSEDDNTLVQGVAGDKGALGYFGFAYYAENEDKLNLVSVDSGSGCIAPSDTTVKDGTYTPLARPLFLYVKKSAYARPEVKAFVEFYIDNVQSLVGDVGYTPVDEAVLAAQKTKLAGV